MSLLPFGEPLFGFGRHDPFRELDRALSLLQRPLPRLANPSDLLRDVQWNEKGDLTLHCQTAGFKPDELKVDVDGDRLTVEGKHVEEKEGESVERSFFRSIRLPKEVDKEKIKCSLDEQGQLVVEAPRLPNAIKHKQSVAIEQKKSSDPKKNGK